MFGQKKTLKKMPNTAKTRHMLHHAEKYYSEGMFKYVDLIVNAYTTTLHIIGTWDLMLNEDARSQAKKYMNDTVIPDMDAVASSLKTFHTGMGHILANVLYNAALDAKKLATILANVCHTGNFQKMGWDSDLKMFTAFEADMNKQIQRIENAFKETAGADVKHEVLNDLYHMFINEFNDGKDRMRTNLHRKVA